MNRPGNYSDEDIRILVTDIINDPQWAAERIINLEYALEKLADIASQCDGWESFPSWPLDLAYDELNKNVKPVK